MERGTVANRWKFRKRYRNQEKNGLTSRGALNSALQSVDTLSRGISKPFFYDWLQLGQNVSKMCEKSLMSWNRRNSWQTALEFFKVYTK